MVKRIKKSQATRVFIKIPTNKKAQKGKEENK